MLERPLPGQFITATANELTAMVRHEHGKEIRRTGEEVTARVLPGKTVEGRLLLQEVRWGPAFSLARPEDWEPWDSDTIKRLEEAVLQQADREERTQKECFSLLRESYKLTGLTLPQRKMLERAEEARKCI